MDWGMKNRLSRIIKKDGHTVMLAVDHGYFLGPTSRLEDPRKTIDPLLRHADAIMLTRGVLRNCVDASKEIPIVLRVSGGNSIKGDDLSCETITTCVEEAIRLNASAMSLSIYIGAKYEHQTLSNFARLVDDGQRYGIPVLAVTAVGRELKDDMDSRHLALCCRIAAELGATYVKTYHCQNFEKVVAGCPVPIVIAGGRKMETPHDVFTVAHDAMEKGAIGVDMGRNIFQDANPVAMIKAIRAIVHNRATPDEAKTLYESKA